MTFQIPNEILEKYKGKKLDELFGNCEIMENEFGEFLKITDPFDKTAFEINPIKKIELHLFERILRSELRLIKGIGVKKSIQLKGQNITDISELLGLYSKNYCEINDILKTISSKDIHQLRNLRKAHDENFLFCVEPKDLLFIDIETTGQTNAEVFLIGIGYYSQKSRRFVTELLFAREIAEEVSLLYYFLELLPRFKMLVTYNGRTFDIPFLRNRVSMLFESEDLAEILNQITSINENTLEMNQFNMFKLTELMFNQFIHFDLYHALRRNYKNLLPNYKLTTAEQFLLDFEREENLPSSEVPLAYQYYIKDAVNYVGGIYKTIEHNFLDVINLERLLSTWIRNQIEEFYSIIYPSESKSYELILEELKKIRKRIRSFNLDPFLE